MKRINSMVLLAASVALLGCTNTPEFNTQTKEEVTLSNGKTYLVPVGASYTKEAVSAKVIAYYQNIGVTSCKQGDITWEATSVADDINEVMRSGSKEGGKEIYKKAAGKGQIGCASPLN